MLLAPFKIIDLDRKMIAARMFVNRSIEAFQKVKLPCFPQGKPGSFKIEGRAWFLFQADHFFVELNTPGNITDPEGHMVEIEDLDHENMMTAARPCDQPVFRSNPVESITQPC